MILLVGDSSVWMLLLEKGVSIFPSVFEFALPVASWDMRLYCSQQVFGQEGEMWHREDQETGVRLRPEKQEAGRTGDKMTELMYPDVSPATTNCLGFFENSEHLIQFPHCYIVLLGL